MEPVGGDRLEHAVVEPELDPHRLQAVEVHVDGPRPEVVASGQGDPRLAAAGE